MSSNKRNSVFSGVVPVMGEAQAIIPLAAGSKVLSQVISEALAETNPTARHSTGSTLLDSFIGDAANEAFALQTELTSLSLELKRIQDPRFQRPAVSPTQSAVRRSTKPAEQSSRDRSRRLAEIQRIQAQRAKDKPAHKRAKDSIPESAPESAVGRAVDRAVTSAATVNPINPIAKAGNASGASPQQKSASHIKVFGGSDYKALQAKAEAGGLVNLDDSLLFGGTDRDASKPGIRSKPVESSFLTYLSEQLEDFTASPIKGGLHPTAHLTDADSAERFYRDAWCQTVLSLDTFKLSDLEDEDPSSCQAVSANSAQPASDIAQTDIAQTDIDSTVGQTNEHPAELNDLGKQVTYLNQRIEYLSRRLSELAATGSDGGDRRLSEQKTSPHAERNVHKNRSPIVMGLESFTASEPKEQRVATLETLSAAL